MSQASDIQEIIAQRRPLAQQLSEIENKLKSLHHVVQILKREFPSQLEDDSENSNTELQRSSRNFSEFEQNLVQGIHSIETLQRRFSRSTLNIGVVGRMGQGKSTLLQSLSGLTNDVIPALQGKACTAARSTICHQEGNQTTAEIQFYNNESFLEEVIKPYYKKLGLEPHPSSFELFAQGELPRLPDKADQTQINIYNRLKEDYHSHAKKYREYLGKGYLNIQDQSQISNYVSQKYDDNNRLINHQCLAVKHVKIFCSFPFPEMGAIAVVDVPGLGDFRLGDESLVVEALAQEVDFILFIRKPPKERASFEQNDTELYNLAKKALNDLPNRSIFVLNVDRNRENKNSCDVLKDDIEKGKIKMPVLDCVIADCSSQEEANTQVLQTVLKNLKNNVTKLDRNYAKEKIKDLQDSLEKFNKELQSSLKDLPHVDDNEVSDRYEDLFDEFWEKITNEMTCLQDKLIDTRDEPDNNLQVNITTVIEDCRQNAQIPSPEEIEKLRNKLDSYASAYSEYLKDLRTSLSRKFIDIEKALKKTIEQTKMKVVTVLVDECGLGGLTDADQSKFLEAVTEQIPQEYSELKTGFEILSEFNLSYRGLIQHRIRLQLDRLTPDKTAGLSRKMSSQDIEEQLRELYQETIYDCEVALNGFLSEPSQASFAIVEEFADRVLRAKNAEKEWKRFLKRKKSLIWPEFKQLEKQLHATQERSTLSEQVKDQIKDLEDGFKKI